MKQRFLTLAIILAFLGLSTISYAGEPLSNADVTVKFDNGKTYTAKTDRSGKFSIRDVDEDCDGFTCEVSSATLPSLFKAKEKANRTKCSSNLMRTSKAPASTSTGTASRGTSSTGTSSTGTVTASPTLTLCQASGRGEVCDDSNDRCLMYITFNGNEIQGMAINEKGLPGEKKPPKGNK